MDNAHGHKRPSLEMLRPSAHRAEEERVEVSVVGALNQAVRRVSVEMMRRKSNDDEGRIGDEGKVNFKMSHGLTTSEANDLVLKVCVLLVCDPFQAITR